jgi:hypothetical protein
MAMSEASMPCLRAIGRMVSPGVPRSTANSDRPRLGLAAGSVRAATMNTSPWSALVTKLLTPSSTQPSGARRAAQVMAATSDPASGSVTAIEQMMLPPIMPGR